MNGYIILATEECGSDLSRMAELGWPGVVAMGLLFAFLGFVVWAITR